MVEQLIARMLGPLRRLFNHTMNELGRHTLTAQVLEYSDPPRLLGRSASRRLREENCG